MVNARHRRRSRCPRPTASCASGATPTSPRWRRADGDAADGHARLRVGRGPRQRLPPGRPDRPSSTTATASPSVLHDYGSTLRTGHRHPPPHALPRRQRRAGLRRRHRAVVLGPRRQPRPRRLDAPTRGMQQATVNLLADMGAQPATLQAGLVAGHAPRPTRRRRPSTITSPAGGATLPERHRRSRSAAPPPTPAAAGRRRRGLDRRRRDLAPGHGAGSPGPTPGPRGLGCGARSGPGRSTTAATSRPRELRCRSTSSRPAPARSGTTRPPAPAADDTLGGRARASSSAPTSAGYITGLRFYKGSRQHRHPRRPASGRARGTQLADGDLHRRDRQRLAAGQLRYPGGDQRRHHLHRLLPRPQRQLRRHQRILRLRRRRLRSAARPGWPEGTERRLQVRSLRRALLRRGPRQLQRHQLLGRRRLRQQRAPDRRQRPKERGRGLRGDRDRRPAPTTPTPTAARRRSARPPSPPTARSRSPPTAPISPTRPNPDYCNTAAPTDDFTYTA